MTIDVNPGSGPVAGAAPEHARAAIPVFLDDVGLPNVLWLAVAPDHPAVRWRAFVSQDDGRYGFLLRRGAHHCGVAMPGVPLEQVRFVGAPQDPWLYPRLYVDGSSWLWCFAVDIVRECLSQA
jgi:hypothetical protein